MDFILAMFFVFLYLSSIVLFLYIAIDSYSDSILISMFCFIVAVFLVVLAIMFIYDAYMSSESEIIVSDVVAYVKGFEYEKPYNQIVLVGKLPTTIYHEEKYIIHLNVEGENVSIESEEFYKILKENDKIIISKSSYVLKSGEIHKIVYSFK